MGWGQACFAGEGGVRALLPLCFSLLPRLPTPVLASVRLCPPHTEACGGRLEGERRKCRSPPPPRLCRLALRGAWGWGSSGEGTGAGCGRCRGRRGFPRSRYRRAHACCARVGGTHAVDPAGGHPSSGPWAPGLSHGPSPPLPCHPSALGLGWPPVCREGSTRGPSFHPQVPEPLSRSTRQGCPLDTPNLSVMPDLITPSYGSSGQAGRPSCPRPCPHSLPGRSAPAEVRLRDRSWSPDLGWRGRGGRVQLRKPVPTRTSQTRLPRVGTWRGACVGGPALPQDGRASSAPPGPLLASTPLLGALLGACPPNGGPWGDFS